MAEQTNFYAMLCDVHVIIYHCKGQPFFYLKQLIFSQLKEEVMIFFKPSYKNKRFPLLSNLGLAFVESYSKFWAKQSTGVFHK